MSKKLIIIITFLALLAGGITYSLIAKTPVGAPSSSVENPEKIKPDATAPSPLPDSQAANGRYIAYTPAALTETSNDTKVVFFHAPWCPQCRSIEKGIIADGVPAGFTILKADYDTNQALRKKYGVTLQTTFVKVDDRGEFIDKFVAYEEPTFESVKRNYLLN